MSKQPLHIGFPGSKWKVKPLRVPKPKQAKQAKQTKPNPAFVKYLKSIRGQRYGGQKSS